MSGRRLTIADLRPRTVAAPAAPPAPPEPAPAPGHPPVPEEVRQWNKAREDAWLTLQQNKARNRALRSAQGRQRDLLLARLREIAPAAFGTPRVPLALGIGKALAELMASDADREDLGQFLKWWTRTPTYLLAVAAGTPRVGIDGAPTEPATEGQRKEARTELGRRGIAVPEARAPDGEARS